MKSTRWNSKKLINILTGFQNNHPYLNLLFYPYHIRWQINVSFYCEMLNCRNHPPYFTTVILLNLQKGGTVMLERVIRCNSNTMQNLGHVFPNDPLYIIETTKQSQFWVRLCYLFILYMLWNKSPQYKWNPTVDKSSQRAQLSKWPLIYCLIFKEMEK